MTAHETWTQVVDWKTTGYRSAIHDVPPPDLFPSKEAKKAWEIGHSTVDLITQLTKELDDTGKFLMRGNCAHHMPRYNYTGAFRMWRFGVWPINVKAPCLAFRVLRHRQTISEMLKVQWIERRYGGLTAL